MGYGSNMLLGLFVFILGIGLMFVLPTMNITILSLDFTTMDATHLWIFRLGCLCLSLFGLYFGATGGEG